MDGSTRLSDLLVALIGNILLMERIKCALKLNCKTL